MKQEDLEALAAKVKKIEMTKRALIMDMEAINELNKQLEIVSTTKLKDFNITVGDIPTENLPIAKYKIKQLVIEELADRINKHVEWYKNHCDHQYHKLNDLQDLLSQKFLNNQG